MGAIFNHESGGVIVLAFSITDKILKGSKLEVIDLQILWILNETGGTTQVHVRELLVVQYGLKINAGTLSKVISRLHKRGYVSRAQGSNRREKTVALKTKGIEAVLKCFKEYELKIETLLKKSTADLKGRKQG